MANRKRKGERPDGLIQVTLDIGFTADGKRKRKSFYGHSRTEAERKRDEYKARQMRGSAFRKDITVGEWVEIFKGTYRQNVDDAYLGNDDVPYNRLVAEIGYLRMIDVTETDLQKALNKVKGMSFSTVNKYKHAINRVFEKARRNKIITDNPGEDLIMPPYTKGTHRALETWEVDLILQHWHDKGLHAGLWVMLMLFCGLRRGEMMALDWSAVDLNARLLEVRQVAVVHRNQTVIVDRAKTDAGLRVLPICQQLYDALVTVPEEMRHGLICLSAHGKQLSSKAVSRGITTFCTAIERHINGEPMFQHGRRTDLEDEPGGDRIPFSFRAHDLRHTFATFLYDAGVKVKAAQYFLGHSDIKMTLDLYTHLSQEREASSRQQMVRYLDDLIDSRFKNASETALFLGDGGKMVVTSDMIDVE